MEKQTNEADVLFGVKGVTDLFSPEEIKGLASIKQIRYEEKKDVLGNLRYLMDGHSFMTMVTGTYTRLVVDGELMMSDTAMERRTNQEFIRMARGKVMIAGLGLGLIIRNIIDKEEVESVTVYEKYQDVIDLVEPKVRHPKLKVVQADILEYLPPKDEKYDTIYHDIWPSISTENLPEIAMLHNRWKTRKNKGGWMSSWMVDWLRAERRRDNRSGGWGW